jgi:hypothetical protein
MAAGDIRYVRAPWGPGQVIKYVDTGTVYNEAPVYEVVGATDSAVSLGLEATMDSLGYRVAEIETHLHSYERWLGLGGETLTPFQIDSGNNDWGAWVEVLAVGDTPVQTGKTYYDLHRLMVVDAEQTTIYRIQLAFGGDGDSAVAVGNYTELMYIAFTAAADSGPIEVNTRRQIAGTRCWARCWNASNTGTLDFYIGLHEYEG